MPENENPYSDAPIWKKRDRLGFLSNPYKAGKTRTAPIKQPKLVTCGFCGHSWKFDTAICPKCHVTYNPKVSKIASSNPESEVAIARRRARVSQAQLAKILGCNVCTIQRIEQGTVKAISAKGKVVRERLRIWIEGTRSPIERRKEIDDMFKEK